MQLSLVKDFCLTTRLYNVIEITNAMTLIEVIFESPYRELK